MSCSNWCSWSRKTEYQEYAHVDESDEQNPVFLSRYKQTLSQPSVTLFSPNYHEITQTRRTTWL
jgi:hypothetical protein